MLKKMRWRFIISAMAAMLTVMIVLTAGINLWNYVITTKRQERTLNMLLEQEHISPFPFDNFKDDFLPDGVLFGAPSPEAPYSIRFFSVHCSSLGEVSHISTDFIASISESDAEEYAKDILKRGKNTGYYQDYRYLVSRTDDEITLIFLNSASEIQFMKTILIVSCTVAFCSLLAVFGLVLMLSKRAIAPYMKNIERQKRFITDAGHEIKTPLTSISTSADVLSIEYGDNEWVNNIQKQTVRLAKLVGNLITLSRLDEETPFPEKTEFSLSDTAWEISEPFAALAKTKEKIYIQNIEDGLSMCGDQSSINQMISILLDNAVRYSDAGGWIQFNVYKNYKNIIIEVFNTCELEDISDIDRLFDRFYRPDQSRSLNTGGNGIGLSIAQAIAEAHGGKITVQCQSTKSIKFKIVM